MSNIEEKKNTQVAPAQDLGEWGHGPNISSNNITIPKILPIQYMSEKLKHNEAEYGELRDTISNGLFGDINNPMEFVPISVEEKWIEFDIIPKKGGGVKREFKQIIPIVNDATHPDYNDQLPLAEEGLERDRVMDFYVLIPEEVEADTAMPYILSFRRTSLKAAKKLMFQMYVRNKAAKKVPAGTVCLLSCVDTQNDDGSYIVQDVKPSRPATQQEQDEALRWFKIIKSGQTKVDESDHERPEAPVTMEQQGDF